MIGACATNPPKDENECNDFSDCILNSIPNSILGDEDYSNALGWFLILCSDWASVRSNEMITK